MTPRAVVFDMDGVLTDTESVWDEVRRGLAAEEGLPWPAGATRAMMGMSTQEWSGYLVGTVGLSGTAEEAARRTIDALAQRYAVDLPALPGAVDAVRRLAARWPLGLASSSPRRLIDVSLTILGIAAEFRVTVSTEEVGRGKPAPDGYLRACELLGADPAQCVAIEDSSNGLRAAAAAGMAVIAVPRPDFPPAPGALELADAVVPHLDDVTLDLVEGLR
ncbi:HAD family phosphatase [Raineyella sp.]|uniref:Phosphorylated carbohydrates phosphatase n=1 Tax=bioreactor metagenome TaxID=1076179 RepID=A0A644XIG1_9ZZZZ|nr:HAD family phosphatase [Raineyella sp.]MEA5154057.1 HAD family phosphatase [Raineyella sp.]